MRVADPVRRYAYRLETCPWCGQEGVMMITNGGAEPLALSPL